MLDGLLEPVAEDRLTPRQALDLLQGRAVTPEQQQRQRGGGVPYAEGAAEVRARGAVGEGVDGFWGRGALLPVFAGGCFAGAC